MNRHDAAAYARLFTADGDVVNVVGWWWQGRAEIESKLKLAFSVVFAESALTITEVGVRFLSSDIAVAHVSWSMKGAKTPPNIPEAPSGYSDAGPATARWRMAHRGVPEH